MSLLLFRPFPAAVLLFAKLAYSVAWRAAALPSSPALAALPPLLVRLYSANHAGFSEGLAGSLLAFLLLGEFQPFQYPSMDAFSSQFTLFLPEC